ncbi:MAG: glycosyltransferase family 2 protein [Opitutales bacterium]
MVPAVSVVLPVHNAAATLARAVASVQAQTFADWELLAVDDGSTDATHAILLELAATDPRVRVLNIARTGIVSALNAGIAAASAPLIARMDADDESHPTRLAVQTDYLTAHPEIGVVGCRVDFGGDRAAGAGYALHVDWLNTLTTPDQIALNRFVEAPFAHPSVMFRRQLAEEHGDYREGDFPEDYELWLRWLDADVRMAKVPQRLLVWNDPPGRLSRTNARYEPEAFFRLKAYWLAEWLQRAEGDRRLKARFNGDREAVAPRQVYVWGAGRPTRQRAAYLEKYGVIIAGYVDVDAKKTGKKIAVRPVLTVAELPPPADSVVLGYVSVRGARDFIRSELVRSGRVEGRDFLMCA